MLEGTKTLATLFSQLYCHLKGEEIPIGDILELDTPLEYFLNGILPHFKRGNQRPLAPNTSFSVHGSLSSPPTITKMVMALLVLSSLKFLEDHLFYSKNVA
jgi:hypothetical protein